MPDTLDPDEFVKPFVSETLGSKSLYFSISAIQSSMNLMQPDALVLEYTRTMMGFLLFNPRPDHIAMIGLGGGSMAKFCHRYLPRTRLVVVEINPHVVALRDAFLIPPDDKRFTVLQGDGALFVRRPPKQYDVLLVDGFELRGIPARLCSQRFYEHCYEALQPGGILVVNLHYRHPQFDTYVARIQAAFKGEVRVVVEPEADNATVFACKGHLQAVHEASPGKHGASLRPAGLPDAAWSQLEAAFTHIAQSPRCA